MGGGEFTKIIQKSINNITSDINNDSMSQIMPQADPGKIAEAAARMIRKTKKRKNNIENIPAPVNANLTNQSQIFRSNTCNLATRIYNPDTYFGKMDQYSNKKHFLKYCKGSDPNNDTLFIEKDIGNLNSDEINNTNDSIKNTVTNSKSTSSNKETIRIRFKNTKNYLYFNILIGCILLFLAILCVVLLRYMSK